MDLGGLEVGVFSLVKFSNSAPPKPGSAGLVQCPVKSASRFKNAIKHTRRYTTYGIHTWLMPRSSLSRSSRLGIAIVSETRPCQFSIPETIVPKKETQDRVQVQLLRKRQRSLYSVGVATFRVTRSNQEIQQDFQALAQPLDPRPSSHSPGLLILNLLPLFSSQKYIQY